MNDSTTANSYMNTKLVTGNHFDKYRSGNPIHRMLVKRFLTCAEELLHIANPRMVVEIGCGPGDLAGRLFCKQRNAVTVEDYIGTDICPEQVAIARNAYPLLNFKTAPASELPFGDGSADLVLACEVFEHLDDPCAALAEACRVSSQHILISVPWEPVWRVLNCARGKYLADWGNTPGHVQHFTRRDIRRLVQSRFDIVGMRCPFPWTMILASKRRT